MAKAKKQNETPEIHEETMTAAQQAAIASENDRYTEFQQTLRTQYLESRVGDLAAENVSLRETIAVMQTRLQNYEDEASKMKPSTRVKKT